MEFINIELASRGSRWILGTGYIDLYRQLHAAEEALYLVEPSSDVVGNALYDELRLEGATNVPDRNALQIRLKHAVALVAGSGVPAVTELPGEPNGVPETSATGPTPEERSLGRVMLRDIRRSINAFRDGQRANLVRARNQLVWTGTITALGGYGLLVLAVIAKAPPFAVLSGVAYCAVGSIVGLFNQLRGESSHGAGEEDFGFSRARLLYTPVLSGFAAIGGVLVVSLLYETVDFHAGDNDVRSLEDIFNIRLFGLGLVIAAVFGLTPDLLVDQLQRKADEYRAALKSTSAGASGTPSV